MDPTTRVIALDPDAERAEARRRLLRLILASNRGVCNFVRHRANELDVYRNMRQRRIARAPDGWPRVQVVEYGRNMVQELVDAGVPEHRRDLVSVLWAFIHGIDIHE